MELALARLVPLADQELQGLLAGGLLAAADDAAVLVLDKILLLEATSRLLRGAMVDLGLRTNSDGELGHLILLTAVFFGDSRNADVVVCLPAFFVVGVTPNPAVFLWKPEER